ncbi:MAG: Cilia- and flagella-associated protein 52, partial [Marteilia pararefringens]
MPDNLPSTHNKQLILERFIGQRSDLYCSALFLVKYPILEGDIGNALEFESATESLIFPLSSAIVQKKIRMDDCDQVASTGFDIEKIGCFKYKGGLCIVGEAECRETMAKVQISSLQDLTCNRSKTTIEPQTKEFEYSMHLSGVIAVDISHEHEYCASLGSKNDGKRTFRIWEIDKIGARLDYREVNQNKHIGEITGLEFSDDDKFVFLSTIKGEIIVIEVERMVIRQIIGSVAGKQLKKITCLKLLTNFSDKLNIDNDPVEMPKDTLALCDVDGGIKIIEIPRSNIEDKIIKQLVKLRIPDGYVKSLCKVGKREIAIISDKGLLASFNIQNPLLSGLNILHESFIQSITSLKFAEDTDKLFLASGGSKICIFQSSTMTLKTIIEIKSLECLSNIIIGGGSIILSGWSDGSIRAFGPES